MAYKNNGFTPFFDNNVQAPHNKAAVWYSLQAGQAGIGYMLTHRTPMHGAMDHLLACVLEDYHPEKRHMSGPCCDCPCHWEE